jgi:hypothetical protein
MRPVAYRLITPLDAMRLGLSAPFLSLRAIFARRIQKDLLHTLVNGVVGEAFGPVGLAFKRSFVHANTMRKRRSSSMG